MQEKKQIKIIEKWAKRLPTRLLKKGYERLKDSEKYVDTKVCNVILHELIKRGEM